MPITEEFVKHLMEQNAVMAVQISQLTKTVESLNAGISLAVTLYELTEGKGRSLITKE